MQPAAEGAKEAPDSPKNAVTARVDGPEALGAGVVSQSPPSAFSGILRLQRLAGNAVVTRLLARSSGGAAPSRPSSAPATAVSSAGDGASQAAAGSEGSVVAATDAVAGHDALATYPQPTRPARPPRPAGPPHDAQAPTQPRDTRNVALCDLLMPQLRVQRTPVKDAPLVATDMAYHDHPLVGLKLIRQQVDDDPATGAEYLIKGTTRRIHWKDGGYHVKKGSALVPFDAGAYLAKVSGGAFTEFTTTFKEAVATTTKPGVDPALKNALSLYVLQQFYVNACYSTSELAKLEYQATPLQFVDEGTYLRNRATGFVDLLKQKKVATTKFDMKNVTLVKSMDFNEVLGQTFHHLEVGPSLTDGTDLKARLAGTVKSIVDYVTDQKYLFGSRDKTEEFQEAVGFTFLDLGPYLAPITDQVGKSAEIKSAVKDFETLVLNTVVWESYKEIIDRFLEKHYATSAKKEATRTWLGDELWKLHDVTPKIFLDFLEAQIRNEKVQQLKTDQAIGGRNNPAQLDKFRAEFGPFRSWLWANRFLRGPGRQPFRWAGQSDEAKFMKTSGPVTANPENALFLRLTRVADGSFKDFLDYGQTAAGSGSYVDRGDAALNDDVTELKKLSLVLTEHAPHAVMIGGTVSIEDQPALLLAPDTAGHLRGMVSFTLNKSGYNPTPTSAISELLDDDVPLREIVEFVIEQQSKNTRNDRDTNKKLADLLRHLRSFDPSAFTSGVDESKRAVYLKGAQDTFKAFGDLSASSLEHVAILSGGVNKLVAQLGMLADDTDFPTLMLPKLKKEMEDAIANQHDLVQFIRNMQNLHELVLLRIQQKPVADLADYTFGLPAGSQPHVTDYSLKAFAQAYAGVVAQHGDDKVLHVDAFNNIYFELRDKLAKTQVASTDPSGTAKVELRDQANLETFKETAKGFDLVDAKAPRPDLVMIDIHPNDAAKTTMQRQQVSELIEAVFVGSEPKYRCTVIVDITLNHIMEAEVGEIQTRAKAHIDSGQLNLVFIQSLTKFSEFGLDKLSGGLMYHFNKSDEWTRFNESVAETTGTDVVHPTIDTYFKALFKYTSEEQTKYLNRVRANTAYVFKQLKARYGQLGIADNAIQFVDNSGDAGTCYIAFHWEEFLGKVVGLPSDADYDKKAHKLNVDILEKGIVAMLDKLGLPIGMRQSFGFPLSNIGDTGTMIRLTIGIEDEKTLQDYVDVMAFMNAKLSANPTKLAVRERDAFLGGLVSDVQNANDLRTKLEAMFPPVTI